MNLALFDFDGTITASDTFTPFLRFAVRRRRVLAGAVLLAPLSIAYHCRMVPACRARPIAARFGFRGEDASFVRELGLRYATQVLPDCTRGAALDRIAWHQQQGDLVVVVSASLDVYLQPWCDSVGVACICTTLEEEDGRLTGRYRGGDCSGEEKVRRIAGCYELSRFRTIYAYGDTAEDRAMLEMAHRRYYRWREFSDWREIEPHAHPRGASS